MSTNNDRFMNASMNYWIAQNTMTPMKECLKELDVKRQKVVAQINREKHKSAEALYAIALIMNEPEELMRRSAPIYAKRCLEILASLPSETLEDCATSFVSIEGVPLPDLLYFDVAKARFEEAGIGLES